MPNRRKFDPILRAADTTGDYKALPKDFTSVEPGDKFRLAFLDELDRGGNEVTFAKSLVKGPGPANNKLRGKIRKRCRKLIERDPRFVALLHDHVRGEAQLGLVPAMKGLVERASRGRPDAVKPLMEITGFHSSKQQHEHTGEIKITMDIPRPQAAELEEEVVDAEVVED